DQQGHFGSDRHRTGRRDLRSESAANAHGGSGVESPRRSSRGTGLLPVYRSRRPARPSSTPNESVTGELWQSPLSTRYASPAIQRLWGEQHRIGQWRRVWLALADSEQELGVAIPEAALTAMRAHLDYVNLASA